MKKVLLIILSLIMVFSLAACSSTATTQAETRAANDKSWPTKTDASVMKGVPVFSEKADLVTVEKTAVSTNADKKVTYSEIVYIKYKNETQENVEAYVATLVSKGFIEDTKAEAKDVDYYWASIAGSDANAIADYSKPYIEITYGTDGDYNFTIKVCWL